MSHDHTAPKSSAFNAVVLVASLTTFCGCFSATGYVPVAPFLASRGDVGWLLLVQGLASCVALVPSGRAVDKQGPAPVLKQGMALCALGILLTGVSPVFYVQLLGRLVVGFAASVMFNAGMALIMDSFQEPARSKHLGAALGLGTTGNLIGPPLAGYLYQSASGLGLPQPQGLAFAPALALLGCAYGTLQWWMAQERDRNALLLAPLVRESSDGKSPFERFFGVYAAAGVRSWVVAAALAAHFGAMSALLCAGVLDLHRAGFSASLCGLAPVPAGILQVLISPLGGKWSNTATARSMLMILCPLALALGLSGTGLATSLLPGSPWWMIVLALSVGSATTAALDAPSISMMGDLASMNGCGHGAAVTASELAVTFGQAVGPPAGVLLLKCVGYDGLCFSLAAVAAVVCTACAATLRHVPHEGDDMAPLTAPWTPPRLAPSPVDEG